MDVKEVDERDSSWEIGEPRFRVYLFLPPHMATATYDLTGTDVVGAIRWAQDAAGSKLLFSIALVHDEVLGEGGRERGLVWILGTDANVSNPTPREQAALDGMWARHRSAPPSGKSP